MSKRDKLLQAAADDHAVIKNHPGGRMVDVALKNAFIAGANWQREFGATFGRELQHYKPDDRPSFGYPGKKNRKSLPKITKTHLIESGKIYNAHATLITTRCGMEGYPDQANEFDTVNGDKFEAYTDIRKVTCRRCNPEAK